MGDMQLETITKALDAKLKEEEETVRRIVASIKNPDLDEDGYRKHLLKTVMSKTMIEVQLCPKEAPSKALEHLTAFLKRDEWIYVSRQKPTGRRSKKRRDGNGSMEV